MPFHIRPVDGEGYYPLVQPASHGHAIFINGIPSAGKSSAAAEIKRRTSTFRVLTGDEVIRRVPYPQRRAQAKRLFALTLETVEQWMESSNVIVDGAWTQQQVVVAKNRFGGAGLYVILRIDEAERTRREAVRQDRQLGSKWDPSWHEMPGPNDIYDLVIDSGTSSPSECANLTVVKAKQHWEQDQL